MARQPLNQLVIVSDQERCDLLGSYGSQFGATPTLDRLAEEAVVFDHAYTAIGICSPARASILTGLYPHAHGMLNNCHGDDAIIRELPNGMVTYSQLLAQAGMRLGFVGKWHVGREKGPARYGFHDVVGAPYDVAAAQGPDSQAVSEPIYAEFRHDRMLVAGVWNGGVDTTESHLLAEAAIDLLKQYRTAGVRFHLRLDFPGPHHPYLPPLPWAAAFSSRDIPPWPNFYDDLSRKPVAQRRLPLQRGVEHWQWEDWQAVIARHLGYLRTIDYEIGRVLAALNRLGLAETTIVVHTADHGDMLGSHRQFNKGPLMYEEVYHVPLLMRIPGVAPKRVGGFVRTLDLMPTFLEMAGLPIPDGLHAQSLWPLLIGDNGASAADTVYAQYHGEEWGLYSQRMVRTAEAKFVFNPHDQDELYLLSEDPHELVNRAEDPRLAPVRQTLEAHLLEWMARLGDPLYRWARKALG